MKQLEEMVELLVGHFDNRNQYANCLLYTSRGV